MEITKCRSDVAALRVRGLEGESGFALAGPLDITTADELQPALMGAESNPLLLDLSEITFMDSVGLHALLELVSHRQETVVVRSPSWHVRRLVAACIPDGVPGLDIE